MTTDERGGAAGAEASAKRTVTVLRFPMFEDERGVRDGIELRVHVCPNADCDCTELTLIGNAYTQEPGHEGVANEPRFRLVHDVATQKTSGFPRGASAEEVGLFEELRKALRRKANKETLRRLFEVGRAAVEPVAEASYDFSAHHDGTMASYQDVFPRADVPVLRRDGTTYHFYDDWCVRPSCSCVEGVVTVCTPVGDPDAHEVAPIGAVRLPTGEPVDGVATLAPALREAALGPELQRIFSRHRERLRAEAERRWGVERPRRPVVAPPRPAPVAPSPRLGGAPGTRAKVGRNEPCPCGSGKKFKQCCLRRG